jgi:hypothetical protein
MRAIYDLQNRKHSINALTMGIESDSGCFSFCHTIEMSRAFECRLSKFPWIKIRDIRHGPANAGSGLIETQHGVKQTADNIFVAAKSMATSDNPVWATLWVLSHDWDLLLWRDLIGNGGLELNKAKHEAESVQALHRFSKRPFREKFIEPIENESNPLISLLDPFERDIAVLSESFLNPVNVSHIKSKTSHPNGDNVTGLGKQ